MERLFIKNNEKKVPKLKAKDLSTHFHKYSYIYRNLSMKMKSNIYHRATETTEIFIFSFAGRRRQMKIISPAGLKKIFKS